MKKRQKTIVTTQPTVATKIFGTACVILSGFILYLDKIYTYLDISVENLHGWSDQENYIWALTQTISPILIMIGLYLRPYFYSLLIPIFCYVLQFYFVLDSSMTIDKPMTWIYVSGTSLLLIFTIWITKKLLVRFEDIRNVKMNLMEEIIVADDEIIGKKINE